VLFPNNDPQGVLSLIGAIKFHDAITCRGELAAASENPSVW